MPIETDCFFASTFMQRFPNLIMLESRRIGGVSNSPYHSLNLGINTKDVPEHVQTNRHLFFERIGVRPDQIAGGLQVHGTEVLKVEEGMYCSDFDAFVTNRKNTFLTIGIADCTPVLIYDSKTQSVGAAHAGWRGTAGRIVQKVLSEMNRCFGTHTKDCVSFIGTCIDTESFEVGEEVAAKFDREVVHYFKGTDKPHIDLKEANKRQLIEVGVLSENIEISPYSTFLNNDLYFSYRKENGTTGRMLAVVGMKG